MRLINTRTYEIREISPGDKPTYAILSHTWGDDEYVFSDRDDPHRHHSAGFKKISRCCALAASQGYKYLWIDTCCIDKTSSAELTESINSMYRWYSEAGICYVYLSDFLLEQAQHGMRLKFHYSRWFTRGWTLQELLAPKSVIFYDADWHEIGSKTFLKDTLSQICRISVEHLSQPKEASVATKMSWASTRKTTRQEDTAYCLLGLFGVNMPLIYGEGANAFFRLQCEIIQSSSDESIFAWKETLDIHHAVAYSGLLAAGPWCFEESGGIVPMHVKNFARSPYFLTNQGLSIEVNTFRGWVTEYPNDFEVSLKVNRDSRLDRRVQFRSRIIKTFLACARESNKEAPVILTLGIIDGRLASRVSCETLEFDPNAIQPSTNGFITLQSSRQLCIIAQQRGFKSLDSGEYVATRFILPFTSLIELTPAFEEVFILDKCTSTSLTIVEDGSILVHHQAGAEPCDRIRLHFSSLGYRFSLEWDNAECFNQSQYLISFSDVGAATNHSVSLGTTSEHVQERPSRGKIEVGDNLSTAIDDKLSLWISTRHRPENSRQYGVFLDVTSIDRSKLLFSLE